MEGGVEGLRASENHFSTLYKENRSSKESLSLWKC